MARVGALFIIACMTLISASVGAVLFLLAGVDATGSAIAALAVLIVLTAYQAVTARLRDRIDFGAQIAGVSRGAADLTLRLTEVSRRVASLESRLDMVAAEAAEKAYSATKPITAEIGDLGNLVKQLAETVSVHELKLVGAREFMPPLSDEAETSPPLPPEKRIEAVAPEHKPEPVAESSAETAKAHGLEAVREAIDANRTDLYLQPIVTLPQRKVRYYEAFTWLHTKDDTLLPPAEFVDAAEAGGLMPQLDNLLLFRSVQVIRRLQLKNRDVGLFCGMSVSTLIDAQTFPQILQFMDTNRALGPSFVLQFKQKALLGVGPLEIEALAALREFGFRFCIDDVTDLRLDPRELSERGIRYVKIPAPLLLGKNDAAHADIHIADLSDLLRRFGIELIAERIETEAQVIDVLEYDVRFGQGGLFSQPRPVRAEALRATDLPTRDSPDRTRDQTATARPSGIAL